jgi:hypothetical protein
VDGLDTLQTARAVCTLLAVESQRFGLVRPGFQQQLLALGSARCSLQPHQHATRNALATILWAHIHALELTNTVCDYDRRNLQFEMRELHRDFAAFELKVAP